MPRHLVQINKTWYFRLYVPTDLQPHFDGKEIKHSLKCTSRKIALAHLAKYELHYQQLFLQLRLSGMSTPRPSKRAIEIFSMRYPLANPLRLNPHNVSRALGMSGVPLIPEFQPEIYTIQTFLDMGYEPDENGQWDTTVPPQNESIDYRQPATPLQVATTAIPVDSPPPSPVPTAKKRKAKYPLLKATIEAYLSGKLTQTKSVKKVKKTTIDSYRGQLNKFLKFVGDCPLDVAASKINAYTDHEYHAPEGERNRSKSRRSSLGSVTRFYAWCKQQKLTDFDLEVEAVVYDPSEADTKGNRPYTSEQIQLIIDNLVQPPKPAKLATRKRNVELAYVILVALFTGYRIDEILQLTTSDLDIYNGLYCLNLQDVETKNQSSKRVIPMHPSLKQVGLLTYRDKLPKDSLLFSLSYASYTLSLSNLLKMLGIKSRKNEYTFHSFRHNAATSLKDVDASTTTIYSITGWKQEGIAGTYIHPSAEGIKGYYKYISLIHKDFVLDKLIERLKKEVDFFYP